MSRERRTWPRRATSLALFDADIGCETNLNQITSERRYTCTSVSQAGLFLQTTQRLDIGAPVRVRMAVHNRLLPPILEGEVARLVANDGGSSPRLGVGVRLHRLVSSQGLSPVNTVWQALFQTGYSAKKTDDSDIEIALPSANLRLSNNAPLDAVRSYPSKQRPKRVLVTSQNLILPGDAISISENRLRIGNLPIRLASGSQVKVRLLDSTLNGASTSAVTATVDTSLARGQRFEANLRF